MPTNNPFQKAEDEYFRLKGQLTAGRITREQFDAAIKELMVQDAQGRWWMLGADSGKWYVHDGTTWVEAQPPIAGGAPSAASRPSEVNRMPTPLASAPFLMAPQTYVAPVPPPTPASQKSGMGCGKNLACGCVMVILLCIVVWAGGFLAYQSGLITQTTLLNLIGVGPGDVQVDNFRDDMIHVTINQLDAPKDSPPARTPLQIKEFDVAAYRAASPGRYHVDFGTTPGGTNLGACTLTIKSGDQYQFIALPDNIVIHRANNPASLGGDFVISISALCR